jgi:hypothetical protein
MEKFYMSEAIKLLLRLGMIYKETIRVFSSDELVVEATDFVNSSGLKSIEDIVKDRLGMDVRATSFVLKDLGDGCFVKEFQSGSFEFKNVPSTFFAQVYKKYFNMPIEPMDKVFMYEGKLAQFI